MEGARVHTHTHRGEKSTLIIIINNNGVLPRVLQSIDHSTLHRAGEAQARRRRGRRVSITRQFDKAPRLATPPLHYSIPAVAAAALRGRGARSAGSTRDRAPRDGKF